MATYTITTLPIDLEAGDIINCSYTGNVENITLPKGTYKLECWGASGGYGQTSSISGGLGGYSVGNITLTRSSDIYLLVGGEGSNVNVTGVTVNGGFNGGGNTRIGNDSYPCGSGGGASDIRIGSNSLYSRVIVAGGGGGAGYQVVGGNGGGTSGTASENGGQPGTQTAGGAANSESNSYTSDFGIGGGSDGTATSGNMIVGGGGGWYGGASHNAGSSAVCGGGGGSGYVYNSTTAVNYPSGCTLNSNYYLSNSSTVDGSTSFPSTSGSTETGHSGNGYIRITVIDAPPEPSLYIKVNNHWIKII